MSRDEVVKTMGRDPKLIATKRFPDRTVEVVEYSKFYPGSPYYQVYWLAFVNNTLAEVARPIDYQREPDHISEIRIR